MLAQAAPRIIRGLTEIVAGPAVALGSAYLNIALRRRQRLLECRVVSAPLLRFVHFTNCGAYILVRETLPSGKRSGRWRFVPIRSAYVFEVTLRNIGSEVIPTVTVEISLHGSATIVQWGTRPAAGPGYDVVRLGVDSEPHVVRAMVPFINPGERFLVGILSVENRSTACQVRVVGRGVRVLGRPPVHLWAFDSDAA
jgi:hypothetical protein